MRRLLEPYACRNAADEIDAETLDQLEQLCHDMHRSGENAQSGDDRFKDYKDFANQDAEFHRLIATHSGNLLLADAIIRLRSHIHQYRVYFKHGVVDETAGEHEAVLEALRAGDASRAEKAMLDHITKSYARISSSLGGTPSE
jgi:DNA-binding GntR family transcriptional regulator